jgi:hypothetical protein
MSFFISLIKLQQILAFALRTIVHIFCSYVEYATKCNLQYSINKSKVFLGFFGQEWEQSILSELDSALNQWVDSVPDHCATPGSLSGLLTLIISVGSALGPKPQGPSVFRSVGDPLGGVLSAPDHDPPTLH